MNTFMENARSENNYTRTENGALTHQSTLSGLLDFFALGGALRTRTEAYIIDLFVKAFAEDRLLALKTLFYLRDIRGGQGERRTFRIILKWLVTQYPELVIANLNLISEYGRWDDLIESVYGAEPKGYYSEVRKSEAMFATGDLLRTQLIEDLKAMEEGKSISLLAKWLPSVNASSNKTKRLAKYLAKNVFGLNEQGYRKKLSALRGYLKVTERAISQNQWKAIDFAKVPGRAHMIYRKAFGKHTPDEYKAYLDSLKKGETKVNTDTLYPYDIVEKVLYQKENSDTLHLMWENLPNYCGDSDEAAIVVADVSGSMVGRPMAVSISLAMYLAERNKGAFHDYFMTFSTEPSIEKIKGTTLFDRINNLSRANWSMSTNIQAIFDVLLNTALENNTPQEELPKKIFIVSDMEFDSATSPGWGARPDKTNYVAIKDKYAQAGYEMPVLVFWNVDARNKQSPVEMNENGVYLVSGCSPSIFKNALNTTATNPVEMMLEVIESERYSPVSLG